MTENKTKHVIIVTIDRPSIEAMKTDVELSSKVMAIMMFFDKTDQVPAKQGLAYRRELIA